MNRLQRSPHRAQPLSCLLVLYLSSGPSHFSHVWAGGQNESGLSPIMQQVPAYSHLRTLEGQSERHSGMGNSHLPNPDSSHNSVHRCISCPAGVTLTICRMEGREHGLKQGPKCSSHLGKELWCLGPRSKYRKRGKWWESTYIWK